MEKKYADIFITAWCTVLESFSSKQLIHAEIHDPNENADNCDILVSIGIIGDINGQVAMAMDVKTGKILASEMLGGMDVTDMDELVTSAVSEMCNMIMGNACLSISSETPGVDITPPTVICNQAGPHPASSPSYKISFKMEDLDDIDFNVEIATA